VELPTILAPLSLDVFNHPEELPNIPIKEFVVVIDYMLQVLHSLHHRFHSLEALLDRRIEIRYGVRQAASRTMYWVHSKRVIVAGVTAVVTVTLPIKEVTLQGFAYDATRKKCCKMLKMVAIDTMAMKF
jgi:hypothetical protein